MPGVLESASVADELRRFVEAFEQADRSTLDALLSHEPGFLIIGSHGQWMTDRNLVLDALVNESLQTRPRILGDAIAAYESGDLAWAADNLTWTYPDGKSLEYRWTVVLHRSRSGWRIVQSHLSAPEPD
jgi:ketosteroid isomerase-like protein